MTMRQKILDVSERLQFEVEENTETVIERAEGLEKDLQEARKAFADKNAKLKGYKAADDAKLQNADYQGQYDCVATIKPKVQQKLSVYFFEGWTVALDELQVESSSSLKVENNIPIPEELVIIPNPKIQGIINDESPIREVDRATTSAALSSTEEPPHVQLLLLF